MRAAVCTVLYPSAERFWPALVGSVEQQTSTDFELVVALDGVTAPPRVPANVATRFMDLNATSANAKPSIADARNTLWSNAAERADVIIMIDADDEMEPGRVTHARDAHAAGAMVSSCALALVDEQGRSLGITQGADVDVDAGSLFPEANIVGGSNASFDASLLRSLLPVPSLLTVVDWYLALRAWLGGVEMKHDKRLVGTRYRQHGANIAGASPRADATSLSTRASLVDSVLAAVSELDASSERSRRIRARRDDVRAFAAFVDEPSRARAYADAFNARFASDNERRGVALPWWKDVAARELEAVWRRT